MASENPCSVSSPETLPSTKRKRDDSADPPHIKGSSSSSNKKLKKFLRDPRTQGTDYSRHYPAGLPKPAGHQYVNDESTRAEEEPSVRTEYCQDYFTDGGCKNEMCRFAHGDPELNEPFYIPPKDAIIFCPIYGEVKGQIGIFGPPPFSAFMFPYIDPSHIGIVFGKRGEIFQWICNLTGVKITVENNKKVPGFKKIVISGSMRRSLDAITLVDALLDNFVYFAEHDKIPPVHDYKTQLCKNYVNGSCKHDANTCCFAHGDSELRPSSVKILLGALKARREGKKYSPQ